MNSKGSRPKMLAVGAVASALFVPGAYRVYQNSRPPDADLIITGRTPPDDPLPSSTGVPPKPTEPAAVKLPEPAEVVVHVAGSVKKPGVYHLSGAARAEDALTAAGGAKADAYLDAINLAAHLEDGQQLYVPNKKEQATGGAGQSSGPSASDRSPAKPGRTAHTSKLTKPGQGTVNVNTASAEELQRLPGVGPAMAARILEYRKANGGFPQAEDLMSVKGIGEKKFAKMKPFVRVK